MDFRAESVSMAQINLHIVFGNKAARIFEPFQKPSCHCRQLCGKRGIV